jgi:APA family basic amino acid/polyamine antiporter
MGESPRTDPPTGGAHGLPDGAAPPPGSPGFLQRTVGPRTVFAITYASLAGGLYLLLGPIAGNALGATPFVMAAAAVLFGLAVMTFTEGAALHPERSGSPTFARHAFDEVWSFVAAWALLLDSVLLTSAATLAATNYLEVVWHETSDGRTEIVLAALVLLFVTVRAVRGGAGGPSTRVLRLAIVVAVDLLLQVLVVVVGLALLHDPGSVTDGLDLGTSPDWQGVLFGLGAAMVVVTGLESASGLAGELRVGKRDLRRLVATLPVAMFVLFVGVSLVGLMALPVRDGETALGGRWVDAPVIGIIDRLSDSAAIDVLQVVVGVAAAATLVGMALASLSGAGRIAAQLARHRQMPTRLGRLHPTFGTPWLVIVVAGVVAMVLVSFRDMDALVGTMAFGAMTAVTIAHLSIIRLRFTEPGAQRDYRIPLNVPFRGAAVPVPAVLGAVLSALVWVSIVVSHPAARAVGLAWMVVGVAGYVVYRRTHRLPVRGRVTVPDAALRREEKPVEYGSILVPVLGTALDDDLIQTAGRLAGGDDETDLEEGYAVIEAVWIHVLPMSLPIDGPLPDGQRAEAKAALARARAVGEEYDGVRVATSAVRARSYGRGIVEEAERRGCEAIIMVAPPPTGRSRSGRAGSALGAIGGRGEALGVTARYVVEHARCQVILGAPSLAETEEVLRRRREAESGPARDDGLDDDDAAWLDQL